MLVGDILLDETTDVLRPICFVQKKMKLPFKEQGQRWRVCDILRQPRNCLIINFVRPSHLEIFHSIFTKQRLLSIVTGWQDERTLLKVTILETSNPSPKHTNQYLLMLKLTKKNPNRPQTFLYSNTKKIFATLKKKSPMSGGCDYKSVTGYFVVLVSSLNPEIYETDRYAKDHQWTT